MYKKLFIILFMCLGLILLFPPLPEKTSLTSVFRVSENPIAITRGTKGSALTINISFGDEEVKKWIQELQKPYPFLFIDMEWASRYPETIRLIREKNISIGLLGANGATYTEDATLLLNQMEQFQELFERKPLWFRTADEEFPFYLRSFLVEMEVNALGSTFKWNGGEIPPMTEGEIISVPLLQDSRISLLKLKALHESRDFSSIEDVIFGTSVKIRKFPE